MTITIFGYSISIIILFWLLVRIFQSFQKSAQEKKIAKMNPEERKVYGEKLKTDIQKELARPRTFFEKFAAVLFWGILGILLFGLLALLVYFKFFDR